VTQRTLFISDLHLDPSVPAIARQFLRFLREEARGTSALYILGDLFEVWLGDDDPDPAAREIVAALHEFTATGTPCFFMHGNRDFLVGERFARDTGCQLVADGTVVEIGGERVLLMHGDALCTDDRSYQRLRRIVRNPVTQWAVRHMSLEQRRRLASRLREGSRMHVGETAAEIMDVNPAAVTATMQRARVATLVHGHTHRPAIHPLTVDGSNARRIVLGDWHARGSVLDWRDDGVELKSLER
jgi:UDP-2,3-diacylglucosamine hydrolase